MKLRKIFEGQLPLEDTARDQIIDDAFVVLDTNVLLDLYRYSRDTSEEFFEILEGINDRLWMPHHVGWEFLRRRSTVRASLTKEHHAQSKAIQELTRMLKDTHDGKPLLSGNDDERELRTALSEYSKKLNKQRGIIERSNNVGSDPLLERVLDLYDSCVGREPTAVWYEEQGQTAERRYRLGIPPGYKDGSKESNRYGDYYIWSQCLDKAKALGKPMVFVTRDSKEDWWEKAGSRVLGPHTELLHEFWAVTGQRLITMDPTSFYDKFRALTFGEESAGSTARDEIAASQASSQQRSTGFTYTLPTSAWESLPNPLWGAQDMKEWLAGWRPPSDFGNYSVLARAAMAAAEFDKYVIEHPHEYAIDDDDFPPDEDIFPDEDYLAEDEVAGDPEGEESSASPASDEPGTSEEDGTDG